MNNLSAPLSIIATTLAVASFAGTVWRAWRDRPRLIFYVNRMTFTNMPKGGDLRMMQVLICNIGYRPIVLTKFIGFGRSSSFSMGIDDEPAAMLGRSERRFPSLLPPGGTLEVHPISLDELSRNATKPSHEGVFFDPYQYFAVIDSFGRIHSFEAEEARFRLGLLRQYRHPKWWKKPGTWMSKRRLLRRVRKTYARSM